VHLNFSLVVVYEGWTVDYAELFRQVDAALSERARAQLAAKVIFLTQNEALHEVNLRWHLRPRNGCGRRAGRRRRSLRTVPSTSGTGRLLRAR
jgi:hypothetical protein